MTYGAEEEFNAVSVPLELGVTLVEASAGTGKTFAITRLVLRLLLQPERIALREIAVVTFTDKGSNELVTRIRQTLRRARELCLLPPSATVQANESDLLAILNQHREIAAERLDAACAELDQLSVSTIHAFCLRILTEQALEAGVHFDAGFLANDAELFVRAAHDWARRVLVRDGTAAAAVATQHGDPATWVSSLVRPLTRHPHHEVAPGSSPLLKGYVEAVLTGAKAERASRHLLTFEDTLERLHRVLTREGPHGQLAMRIRQQFRAALIDEFQDTDAFQFPIFQTAFHGLPLFLIGDPKQSIYAFRGADVRAYLTATSTATRRFTLKRNFRSTPGMVAAVNALFTNQPDPFGANLGISFTAVESADRAVVPEALADGQDDCRALHWVLLEERKAAIKKAEALTLAIGATVTETLTLLDRDLPAKDIAILVHTNEQARDVKAALDAQGIPAVVTSNRDVLESDEGEEILRIALAASEPRNERLIRGAIASRCWGGTATDIARLLHSDGSHDWSEIVRTFRDAHELWQRSGLAAALARLLTGRDATTRLGALPDGERRLTNLRHLLDLLHEEGVGGTLPPTAFRAWLARERSLSVVPERREQRLESDATAVQILTIYKAKGLQWPVVFCPTLWSYSDHKSKVMGLETAFATRPSSAESSDTTRYGDIGSPAVDQLALQAKQDQDDEQRRLTYVALTRAESRCYVVWGRVNKSKSTALAYLLGDDGSAAALKRLIAAHPEAMSAAPAQDDSGSGIPAQGVMAARGVLVSRSARSFVAPLGRFSTWRTSSYSRLVEGRHSGHSAVRDVADSELPLSVKTTDTPATGIFAVPKGPQIGNVLHKLLEDLDFTTATTDRTFEEALPLECVQAALTRFGITRTADARWSVDDVRHTVREACRAQIPESGFRCADVPMSQTLREWKFTMPVGTCDLRVVADALAAHGSAHAVQYATRLRGMDTERFRGYLDGVVDLAFEHQGRWWIVDWKSNHLGDQVTDYHHEALAQAMQLSDYTLQYHIYVVALHRHLRARLINYDPALHWGGVGYAFLRGVTSDGTMGWFRDTPSLALIEALDAALHPEEPRSPGGAS